MVGRMMALREELSTHKGRRRSVERPHGQDVTPREVIVERLSDHARLTLMEERGEIKLGSGRIPADFWSKPRPADPEGEVLDALLDQREYGY